MFPLVGVAALVKGHHIRPDLVHVHALAEVEHIGGVAPRRAHVDLQSHDVSPPAQALLVLREPEKFQVKEPPSGSKGPQDRLSGGLHVGRDLLVHIVKAGDPLVDHVHDGVGGDVAGGEEHFPRELHTPS